MGDLVVTELINGHSEIRFSATEHERDRRFVPPNAWVRHVNDRTGHKVVVYDARGNVTHELTPGSGAQIGYCRITHNPDKGLLSRLIRR